MSEQVNNIPIRKKRKKSKKNFGYLYLFAFVFFIALAGISYIVKSYSPDIDVAIGNNEALTLSDSEMEVEIKSVDERLKWIQMEDEMPTVALRDTDNNSKKDKLLKEEDKKDKTNPDDIKKEKTPPIPAFSDIPVKKPDFRTSYSAKNMTNVIPAPIPSVTKVYLGNYSSIEEAMAIQSKISSEEPDLNPFIKAVRDNYVVQLGSFADSEKAAALVVKLRQRGYSPKINREN